MSYGAFQIVNKCVSRKRLAVDQNVLWDISKTYMGVLLIDVVVFKVILGSFRFICLKMVCNLETNIRGAKRMEIWIQIY